MNKLLLSYDTLALEDILDSKFMNVVDEITYIADKLRNLPKDRDEYYGDYTLMYKAYALLKSFLFNKVDNTGIVHFPLFKKEFCDFILNNTKDLEYTPNLEEPLSAQIPEVLLEEFRPHLFSFLCDFYFDVIADLQLIIYGIEPCKVKTIQLAKYSAENTKCGAWHSDIDSDLTMTVSLNDNYKGGGVDIRCFGLPKIVSIPSLPIGTATLFTGKMLQHRGREVTEGTRDLLVFWSEVK